MKILDRYLARHIFRAFVFALIAFVGLFVMVDLITHRRVAILESEMPGTAVAQYYTALLPQLLSEYNLAGCAAMLATLLVIGACAQRNELTAALAGGVSLFRFVRVPLAFGIAASLALTALTEFAGPAAARQAQALDREYFAGAGSSDLRREPVSWANLQDGWSCHVSKFNRIALTGEDVLMLRSSNGNEEQVRAARMYWDPAERAWMLQDGLWAVIYPSQNWSANKRRITLERAPLVETPDELFAPLEDPSLWTPDALRAMIDSAKARGIPTAPMEVEWHSRLALGAMPIAMVWIAIPLAARIRRASRGLALAVAIALWLGYFLVFAATQALGLHGRLDPWIAVWSANILFAGIGVILYRFTPR
jgi:LPS export ABC transporter permease LptG